MNDMIVDKTTLKKLIANLDEMSRALCAVVEKPKYRPGFSYYNKEYTSSNGEWRMKVIESETGTIVSDVPYPVHCLPGWPPLSQTVERAVSNAPPYVCPDPGQEPDPTEPSQVEVDAVVNHLKSYGYSLYDAVARGALREAAKVRFDKENK
jgi:hypothetical protein